MNTCAWNVDFYSPSDLRRSALRLFGILLLLVLLPVPSAANDWIYAARPGDNIWNLTEKHLKSIAYWKRLQTYNNVENPRRILPGTRLRIPIRWLKVQPASATVESIRGSVTLRLAETGSASPAKAGAKLNSGDAIETGEDSSASIRFADESLLLVHAQTTLVLDSMSAYGTTGMVDTRMRLDRGRLESEVTPARGAGSRYQIITPSAVVAVRGTSFRAGFDPSDETARSEVTEGVVAVRGESARRVPAGFGVVAERGKPVAPPVKLLPAPDLSSVPQRVDRILVSLDWPPVDGAIAYRVQVLRPGGQQQLLLDKRVEAAAVQFDAPVDGEYELRIRAIDERGLEGLDAQQNMLVDARPVPPRLLGPSNGAAVLATQPPELWWSKPQGLSRFRVQLAREETFGAPLLDQEFDDAVRFQLSGELEPGMYFWRASSVAPDGDRGPFGDTSSFRAQAVPDAATASSSVDEGRVTIGWDAVANAERYEFQLARDEEFTDLVVDEGLTDLSYSADNLEGGTYYFRARGISDEGVAGPYSTVNEFEIPGDPLSPGWLMLLAPLLLLL